MKIVFCVIALAALGAAEPPKESEESGEMKERPGSEESFSSPPYPSAGYRPAKEFKLPNRRIDEHSSKELVRQRLPFLSTFYETPKPIFGGPSKRFRANKSRYQYPRDREENEEKRSRYEAEARTLIQLNNELTSYEAPFISYLPPNEYGPPKENKRENKDHKVEEEQQNAEIKQESKERETKKKQEGEENNRQNNEENKNERKVNEEEKNGEGEEREQKKKRKEGNEKKGEGKEKENIEREGRQREGREKEKEGRKETGKEDSKKGRERNEKEKRKENGQRERKEEKEHSENGEAEFESNESEEREDNSERKRTKERKEKYGRKRKEHKENYEFIQKEEDIGEGEYGFNPTGPYYVLVSPDYKNLPLSRQIDLSNVGYSTYFQQRAIDNSPFPYYQPKFQPSPYYLPFAGNQW